MKKQSKKIEVILLNNFIKNRKESIQMQDNAFYTIDEKAKWFFLLISAVEWYMFVSFFINQTINILYSSDLILIILLILWLAILACLIWILQTKALHYWPNIAKQQKEFLTSKKKIKNNSDIIVKYNEDTLKSMNDSYEKNSNVIKQKSEVLKYCIRRTFIYFIIIIIYFLTFSMKERNHEKDAVNLNNYIFVFEFNKSNTDDNNTEYIEKTV